MKHLCYNIIVKGGDGVMKDTLTIGWLIANERNKKGLSQRELARLTGVSNTTISRIENNEVKPDTDTLQKLSTAIPRLSDKLRVVFGGDDNANEMAIKSIQDNHGIIGAVHAPVRIINGTERNLSEQEIELLNLYSDLSVVEKAKLLVYASELKNNK